MPRSSVAEGTVVTGARAIVICGWRPAPRNCTSSRRIPSKLLDACITRGDSLLFRQRHGNTARAVDISPSHQAPTITTVKRPTFHAQDESHFVKASTDHIITQLYIFHRIIMGSGRSSAPFHTLPARWAPAPEPGCYGRH